MKKMLLLITICSFAFSGTLYLSADMNQELEVSKSGVSVDSDLDLGFSIGYNHPFYQKDAMALSIGGSYNLLPMESDDLDGDGGFLNLYLLPSYAISEEVKLWAAFGLSKPTHDIDDYDNGILIGFGVSYKVNDKYSVGLGFNKNIHEADDIPYYGVLYDNVDADVSGFKFFLGYQM
tara:strand:+ start:138 stop:668 length:531 start_codon:yes stop_codon:yes gene_type:complete